MAQTDPLAPYQGLWQRKLYAEPADGPPVFEDETTQVYWLQCGPWHADLRVPADRPDFDGITGLDDCNHEQLVWLASQTAFAGRTVVEGRLCTWHRLIDLSPGLDKDIGEMRFVARDTLEERHPLGTYREIWQRVPHSKPTEPLIELDRSGLPRRLEYGEHAMSIASRGTTDDEHDLLAPARELPALYLAQRLSAGISLSRQSEGRWQTLLSTAPWQEDTSPEPTRLSAYYSDRF